jgi:hypothetical protein
VLRRILGEKKEHHKLTLADYDKIWTKFCFLDESGSLNDSQTPFFTVGLIKCTQPYYLSSKISYERSKHNFYDELKFNKLSKNNIAFAKLAVESFLGTRSMSFCSYTVDRQGEYFRREFDANPWKAYEQLSIRLVEASMSPNEILIVIADHVTTPKNIRFEVNVKRKINEKLKRLAVAGVCRFDSKSNDLLQWADLFIGAINYDLKISTGIVKKGDKHKRRFLKFLKENLGVKDFSSGFKNYMFNIFVDKDVKSRLPLNLVEKSVEK